MAEKSVSLPNWKGDHRPKWNPAIVPEYSRYDHNMIKDLFNRQFNYLRIAVNEKCNLRCQYCMPESGVPFKPENQLLTKDEIVRIVRILANSGVDKVRFTGGEPLLRRDIVDIVHEVHQLSIDSIHLTTNGIRLKQYLKPLARAGLSGINISLDTLDQDKFQQITRRDYLDRVMDNLRRSVRFPGITVKINTVLMRDVNDDEIYDFVMLAKELPLTVRFIELMPFDDFQIWKTGKFMGTEFILERIKKIIPEFQGSYGSKTEEHFFKPGSFAGAIAVIPSFSRTMCQECNRIRLTADGCIRNCLYSNKEYDLISFLRKGCSDEDVLEYFQEAMRHKPRDGFAAEHQNNQTRTSMTQIGG